jgi:hypothetical protein
MQVLVLEEESERQTSCHVSFGLIFPLLGKPLFVIESLLLSVFEVVWVAWCLIDSNQLEEVSWLEFVDLQI